MNATVNISLPKTMYEDAKKMLGKRGYASISELIRDTLRDVVYPKVTENGFTPEFEKMVLESAKEPVDKSKMWDGKGSFVDFVLKKGKNGKNKLHRKVQRKS